MSATQQNRWDGEFGIIPFVESYGAIFENQGESGEIEFTFEIAEDTDYDINSPPRQIEFVESGEQVEVMFNILLPEGVEYEIIGESA